MYSKKLRRVVYVSEATRPPEVATMGVAVTPATLQRDEQSPIFLKPKIARPIAQYPPRMVVQPTRLLSHHGFTPPRIVPTPPVANASSSSISSTPAAAGVAASSSNPIFLGPRGDVELSPVAPSIANSSSTTFTIIVSHNTQPPEQRPMPPPRHHYLPSTLQQPLEPAPEAEPRPMVPASDRPRKRRQRADDLVPAGCGLTRDDIVCLPIDDFNDKVAEKSEKEIVVLKDKRRKGKNRVRTTVFFSKITFCSEICVRARNGHKALNTFLKIKILDLFRWLPEKAGKRKWQKFAI